MGGRATARLTVLVLAFFPTSFFLNAVYTESLFLALSAGSLWALRVRQDLLLACLLAGLATATRNVGLFLLVPLALEWAGNRHAYRWRGAYLALAPGGLIVYGGLPLVCGSGTPSSSTPIRQSGAARPPVPWRSWRRPAAASRGRAPLDPGLRADPSLGDGEPPRGGEQRDNLMFLLFALALLLAGLRWMPPL